MSRIHKIALPGGAEAIVDLADRHLVAEYRWHLGGSGKGCPTGAVVVTAQPAPKASEVPAAGTIEERLSKLKKLVADGLLTEAEAAEKRKEIMKGL